MGRKPKVYQPWENNVESHPWMRYPNVANQSKYLIIGSFPPNKFTTHQEKLTFCDMNFFYGSKENAFWELFCEAKGLDLKLPNDLESLKNWLTNNSWIVSDIVKTTKRKKDTAIDTDLIVETWNIDIIRRIFEENHIRCIFFTSQWVEKKFQEFIRPSLGSNNNSLKNIKEVILLSPSRNGLRKAKTANFTQYKSQIGETSEQYRKRYYSLVLNDCH